MGVGGSELFTFPWPGPGNSEGPVDAEDWVAVGAIGDPSIDREVEEPLLVSSAWAGPGDSEG